MDKLKLTVSIALNNLFARKFRSFLTILGIIIGVGAVVTIVSIGRATSKSMLATLESSGTNGVYVMPGSSGGRGPRGPSARTLKIADALAIQKECPSISVSTPYLSSNVQIVYGGNNWNASVNGVNEYFTEIQTWPVENGSFFSYQEVRRADVVCVLGTTVVRELFGSENPVGKTVRINNNPFPVIGVLESKGSSGGQDTDSCVIIPYTTFRQKIRNIDYVAVILGAAISHEATVSAKEEITWLLRQRHKLGDKSDDFMVMTQDDAKEMVSEVTGTMTLLVAALAAISLIVGGIGIMNIMLVSVNERIREIGLRMAIGARESDIMLQFLVESVVLSIGGGIIGIMLGAVISLIANTIMKLPQYVSWEAALVSILFSALIGVGFGFYPALKASKLDPIDALRNE